MHVSASSSFSAPVAKRELLIINRNRICQTFVVNLIAFKATLFFSPGAGIGMGCWMYIVMGEFDVLM